MPVVLAIAIGSPLVGRLLDKFGSKAVVFVGTILLALGMLMLSNGNWISVLWFFILAGFIIGLGLSALLGAPVRYIMLNEAPAADRTAAQGGIALFTSIGQRDQQRPGGRCGGFARRRGKRLWICLFRYRNCSRGSGLVDPGAEEPPGRVGNPPARRTYPGAGNFAGCLSHTGEGKHTPLPLSMIETKEGRGRRLKT